MGQNFFEQELRKLFENSETLSDPRFTGRVCMARLTDTTNVKLEFVEIGVANNYVGVKATVLNRLEGKIDSSVFCFDDILGIKSIPGNPYLDKVHPHFWYSNGKYEWYAYKPTPGDFEQITNTVDSYLEMFQEPVQSQGMQMR